ncbi:MAG: uracil-DNA glycosylase family protein [Planctomycetota bacterium]
MSRVVSELIEISRRACLGVSRLRFAPPVACVYNPLDYAWAAHRRYLELYGSGRREVVLLGMNPGPFGMAQTGVPFGEVAAVRDWMGICEKIGKPKHEHGKRRVEGFSCRRSEVSGRRLWSWAGERFGAASSFFSRFWVHNYCPLSFIEASGRNRTPDKLPRSEREPLFRICDRALLEVVDTLRPRYLIGIGAFAEKRAREVLSGRSLEIGRIPHPSPANPNANKNWAAAADEALAQVLEK